MVAMAQLGPGDHTLTISRPEGTRTFHVHVPQKYTAADAGSVPLVFAWHGYTEQCRTFHINTDYNKVAEEHTFIVVYPCGTGLLPAFNAGVCCGNSKNDDVEFARLMVVRLSEQLPKINSSRVFTSGFSNGGMMSEQLACKSHGIFRAAVSVSGTCALNPGNELAFDECDKFYANVSRRVAVLKIHGTADPVVPYTGNALLKFPAAPADHKRWAQRTKCVGDAVNTFKQGIYSNLVYEHCAGGPIELLTVQGGVHHWVNNSDFRAAEYAWKFFAQF